LAQELVKDLIDSGVHFGHRVSRWNPKMKPYIYGKRNLIHIIDVKETLKGILLARKFLSQVAAGGRDVLIVGTKRQARKSVEDQAARVNMHCVTDRWLGGTLTNFREIRKRVARLVHLEQLETDGMLDTYSKKEGSSLRREIRKIRRNLGGIRRMEKMPGALVIIDQRREMIAVKEARKMGIPVVCLLDTDCDPDVVDIPIPGNDDAMRSIELVVTTLCDAIADGIQGRGDKTEQEGAEPGAPRRRPGQAMGQAQQPAAAPAPAPAPAAAPAAPVTPPQSQGEQPKQA
jgi:small subunit ribosomal protein S2